MEIDDDMLAGFVYSELENDDDLDLNYSSQFPTAFRKHKHKHEPKGSRQPTLMASSRKRAAARILFWILTLFVLIYLLSL